MKKILIINLILCFFLIQGCNSSDSQDPIQSVNFENTKLDKTISKLLAESVIKAKDESDISYIYNFKSDSLEIPFSLRFNPDDFEVNSLRQIRISIVSDTVYEPEPLYLPGRGSVTKKTVEHIVKTYNDWYGKYDTIVYPEKRKYTKQYLELLEVVNKSNTSEKKAAVENTNKTKTYVWKEDKFDISIYLPPHENTESTNNEPSYSDASITYSVKDYEEQLTKIEDSVRKTLKAPDIVELYIAKPEWENSGYSTKFTYNINGIRRTAIASRIFRKTILAVKYDIVIKDIYNDIIARIPDASFELDSPLEKEYSALSFSYKGGFIYNNNNEMANQYNNAKIMAERGAIKIEADITAVVFKNGSVLEI